MVRGGSPKKGNEIGDGTMDLEEVTLCISAGLDLRWMTSPRHPTPKGSHNKKNGASVRHLRSRHPT